MQILKQILPVAFQSSEKYIAKGKKQFSLQYKVLFFRPLQISVYKFKWSFFRCRKWICIRSQNFQNHLQAVDYKAKCWFCMRPYNHHPYKKWPSWKNNGPYKFLSRMFIHTCVKNFNLKYMYLILNFALRSVWLIITHAHLMYKSILWSKLS